MYPKRVLTYVVSISALLGFSACVSDSAPSLASSNQKVEVHAHRGGAALAPENSLDAFRVAVTEVGVDSLELDIHQTSDNVLIVHHDPTLDAGFCLNPDGSAITTPPTITSMSSAQVAQYDCGTLVGLPAEKALPTLGQVFALVEGLTPLNGQKVQYDLHVKWDSTTISATDYAQLILAVIQTYGVHDRVHFMNDQWPMLQTVRGLDSTLDLYYLVTQVQPGDLANSTSVNLTALVPEGPFVSTQLVQSFHAQGIKVIPWTVDIPYEWQSLIDMDVDGIITDNPIGLKELLAGNLTNQLVLGQGGD